MPHTTQFEAGPAGLVLSRAILLYQAKAGEPGADFRGAPSRVPPAFASIHLIEERDGHPTIGAGAPLSRANLRHWTEALGRAGNAATPEILPPNVLVAHRDMLAWWTPAQVRAAYFDLSTPPKGLRALAQRTVVPVPYPAHLFVATRAGLGVYALPANDRPCADTVVLHSPILNIFIGGGLCWGNIAKPKSLAVSSMADFERAVFESWSTHPNPGQEATLTGKGGLVRLWDDLAASGAQTFPVKRLKPFVASDGNRMRGASGTPMTVGQIIAASAVL